MTTNAENVNAMNVEKQSLCTDDCLEDIIKEYSAMVYRLAVAVMKNKSDADDVFQEVFFRYIRKKPRFDSIEHQKAWLIRVTINCCKSMRSSAWVRKTVPLEEAVPYAASGSKEQTELLSELRKLPQIYRIVIHLYYYEEMSIDEISRVIGKSRSAVKMRLSRARDMLRTLLKEEDYV